jgi:hypothetical protein
MKVPDDQLRKILGIANVAFKQNDRLQRHVAAEPEPRRFLLSRRGSFDLEIAMINEPSKAQLEAARMEMAESSRKSHEDNALKPFSISNRSNNWTSGSKSRTT